MKSKLLIVITLLFSVYSFSQNLVVGKLNSASIPTLLTLNSNTGEILNNVDYVTDFDGNLPESITFDSQTNEIVVLDRIYQSKIVFKNIITNNETSITLSGNYEYQGVIVADNRLFVTSDNIIQEINRSNGNVIGTYTLNLNGGWNGELIYSNTTKDIYVLGVYGTIFKFNIITNVSTSLVLPVIPNGFGGYSDIVIAQNMLFVVKSTADGYSLLEIDTENASIINTYNYNTPIENFSNPSLDLTFLADTQEICAIITGYELPQTGYYIYKAKIIKYNINTNTESFFDLPTLSNPIQGSPYSGIVSIITEENLSSTEFNQENEAKIIKAYNLLGQEIPIETYNQIIILKYDNGDSKKAYIRK